MMSCFFPASRMRAVSASVPPALSHGASGREAGTEGPRRRSVAGLRPRDPSSQMVPVLLLETVLHVHRRAVLEQRLEVAQHPRPAAAGAGVLEPAADDERQAWRVLEFVGHRVGAHAEPPSSSCFRSASALT